MSIDQTPFLLSFAAPAVYEQRENVALNIRLGIRFLLLSRNVIRKDSKPRAYPFLCRNIYIAKTGKICNAGNVDSIIIAERKISLRILIFVLFRLIIAGLKLNR